MKRLVIVLGFVSIMILLACVPAMAISDDSFSVGVGMGIPYGAGIVGGNLNYSIGDYVELSVGVGLAGYTLGYDAGVKVYLIPPENKFRLRASVYYGTNAIATNLFYLESIAYSGVTAGFGGKYSFNHRGAIAFDLMYIVNSPEFEADGYTIDSRVKISGGYIFQF